MDFDDSGPRRSDRDLLAAALASVACPDCQGRGYRNPRRPEDACSTCGGDGVVPS